MGNASIPENAAHATSVVTTTIDEKPGLDVEVSNASLDDLDDFQHAVNGQNSHSTRTDIRHMKRMGKSQQMVRNFHFMSIAAFVSLCTAAWEFSMFLITPGLVDGGRAGMTYSMLWCFVGFAPVYLSMAEMASIAPIAGAQYHWVSEFAPERYQKVLSYVTGWTSTLAWQGGNALGALLVGTLAQATITINIPDYVSPPWQAALLAIGATIIALVANTYGSRVLHLWQTPVFIIHVAMFFVVVVPIWVRVPRVEHEQVWLEFENLGGWSTMTLAVMAGQLSGIGNQIGVDGAAHMSEEIKDAARQVPRAMLAVYVMNFAIVFPACLTLVYHIPSLEDSLNDPTLYPAVYVLRQCWSAGGVTAILVITNVILVGGNVSYLAAVTRDLFAFARDQGLPFSAWIARVDKTRAVPVNAAVLTSAISIALSLIYLGSPVAVYAITSLVTVALLQCYLLSIGCILWRRIYHPDSLPPAEFSLGRYGVLVNVSAVVFLLWCFFWSFWPQYTPFAAADFNWASVLFVATLVLSAVFFVVKGRKVYHGPVAMVEGRKAQ